MASKVTRAPSGDEIVRAFANAEGAGPKQSERSHNARVRPKCVVARARWRCAVRHNADFFPGEAARDITAPGKLGRRDYKVGPLEFRAPPADTFFLACGRPKVPRGDELGKICHLVVEDFLNEARFGCRHVVGHAQAEGAGAVDGGEGRILEGIDAGEPVMQPARDAAVEGVFRAFPREIEQPTIAINARHQQAQQLAPRVGLDQFRRKFGNTAARELAAEIEADESSRGGEQRLAQALRVVADARNEAIELAGLVQGSRRLLHEGSDHRMKNPHTHAF